MNSPRNEYENIRAGMEYRVALQAIRKVVRTGDSDPVKRVQEVIDIVHSFEEDMKRRTGSNG